MFVKIRNFRIAINDISSYEKLSYQLNDGKTKVYDLQIWKKGDSEAYQIRMESHKQLEKALIALDRTLEVKHFRSIIDLEPKNDTP